MTSCLVPVFKTYQRSIDAAKVTKDIETTDPSSGTTISVNESLKETKAYHVTNSQRNSDLPTWTNFFKHLWCFRRQNNLTANDNIEKTDYRSLASSRKFGHIHSVLSDTDIDSTSWLCQDCNRPLHYLLKYKPTLKTVGMVCEALAEISQRPPELVRDKSGFTPLHVACAFGCSLAVIARLVNGSTMPSLSCSESVSSFHSRGSVSTTMSASHTSAFHNNSNRRTKKNNKKNPATMKDDKYGRLPLHWSCVRMHTDLDNAIKVVGYLIDVYPDGVTMTDANGETPLCILKRHEKLHPVKTLALEGIIRRSIEQQEQSVQEKDNNIYSLPSSCLKKSTGDVPKEISKQGKTIKLHGNYEVYA